MANKCRKPAGTSAALVASASPDSVVISDPIPNPTGSLRTIISGDAKSAAAAAVEAEVTRGAYIVRFKVDNPTGTRPLIQNKMDYVTFGGERKRVFFHKIDIGAPVSDESGTWSEGTAIFTVLDNPLPLLPIVWGGVVLAGMAGSWLFVDKLEKFTNTAGGQLFTIAAAALAVYLIARR